ncbi:spore coat associated protein CotJA [Proteiniclasticum sp.]|uniref:spore coat associated protein CotJA n=1 Tax=Proteiniclasticum sp. TaxID=2053595 RepID=UPI00289BC864|nr:spore coat associated protein CotJA [Proteiniclasticum sp.]
MAKSKENNTLAEKDLNSAKPLQVLPTNSAEAPFEGGLGKGFVAPQISPDYYEPQEGLLKGTIFVSLDDGFEI